jgi:Protein of unknown function, DUF488
MKTRDRGTKTPAKLPRLLRMFFWDYNFESLSWERDRDFITGRILTHGNWEAQWAGFSKRDDLAFFLKELCGAEYLHEPLLTPTPDLLDGYRKRRISWQEYEPRFLSLLADRAVEKKLDRTLFHIPTVLLCSEVTATRCHRRLILEYLQDRWGGLDIVHL